MVLARMNDANLAELSTSNCTAVYLSAGAVHCCPLCHWHIRPQHPPLRRRPVHSWEEVCGLCVEPRKRHSSEGEGHLWAIHVGQGGGMATGDVLDTQLAPCGTHLGQTTRPLYHLTQLSALIHACFFYHIMYMCLLPIICAAGHCSSGDGQQCATYTS